MIINPYRYAIDDEWANGNNEVLFIVQGDSTVIDSNDSTGAGPANNGKLWNGSAFVALGTVGPGVGTTDGSFCQQFALDYYTRTGKVVCFVNSGVGSTGCYETWNGVSAIYSASMVEAEQARVAGGFPKVRFIIDALSADAHSPDPIADCKTRYSDWIDAINTDYPDTMIYQVMFGVKSGIQTVRSPDLRGHVYEKMITTSNLHVVYGDLYSFTWGLISADGSHRTQTGHNFVGAKIDAFLAMESLGWNKFAMMTMNSMYSLWASWPAGRADAINTAIAGSIAEGDWHNMLGYWSGNFVHANDRFVDWKLFNVITDRGVTYTLEDFTETNTGGATMSMPITVGSLPYRSHAATDTFVTIRIKDYKSTTAALRIPFGRSSGTNVYALQVSATTGLINLYIGNNTGVSLAGPPADNSRITGGRNGTTVTIYVNGSSAASGTSTAGAALTSGMEVGDRYTAGPAGFPANMELFDWGMGLESAVNQATFYARFETLYANI